jgi:hypothetical protein
VAQQFCFFWPYVWCPNVRGCVHHRRPRRSEIEW